MDALRHRRPASPVRKKRSRCRRVSRFSVFPRKLSRAPRKINRSRLLLRFSRIQETAGGRHDSDARRASAISIALQSKLEEIFAEGLPKRYRASRPDQRARSRLGARARLRIFRRRRSPRGHAHLREKQPRHRCREAGARSARETSSRHRWRLRQNQRPNLPPLQHGRRNRGNSVASPATVSTIACRDSALPEGWSQKTARAATSPKIS